jgi:biopolymer transport protein ExbB
VTLAEFISNVGIVFWPLSFLSVLSLGTILERLFYWISVLLKENLIIERIMETATNNWDLVAKVARDYRKHPIGSFLYAPLKLNEPDPDVFHLALETAADDELALMRRGEKVLEATITISPLLGLLGTVLGLIQSVGSLTIGELGTSAVADVPTGIGHALYSTAMGLGIAIFTLAFSRTFQGFWANQVRIFRKAGNELEVLYRQHLLEVESNSLERI